MWGRPSTAVENPPATRLERELQVNLRLYTETLASRVAAKKLARTHVTIDGT
jgi:hypothetical protein